MLCFVLFRRCAIMRFVLWSHFLIHFWNDPLLSGVFELELRLEGATISFKFFVLLKAGIMDLGGKISRNSADELMRCMCLCRILPMLGRRGL